MLQWQPDVGQISSFHKSLDLYSRNLFGGIILKITLGALNEIVNPW